MAAQFQPLALNLQGRHALVIGQGHRVERKLARLQAMGCQVEQLTEPTALPSQPLTHYTLLVACCGDATHDADWVMRGRAAGCFCFDGSEPSRGDLLFPALIDRSPFTLAVHSDGHAPLLTQLLCEQVATRIPAAFGTLAAFANTHREQVALQLPDAQVRRRFWQQVLSGPIAEMVMAGDRDGADRRLLLQLQTLREQTALGVGEVYLVGAGPGDPDLLTLKALRLMQQADIVVYDRLVSPAIMALLPEHTPRLYVGKARAQHALPQEQINQTLVDLAQQGKRVLRLKGGDPFIFGRGGEEIDLLAQHRIPFQVVPGITAANGCAAYAGIPLTHRDHAQSVRFITGHRSNDEIQLPWPELARAGETLVFYMGLVGLEQICAQLIRHGRAANTPAAIVQQGTLPQQRVLVGTLQTLPQQVAEANIQPPTLLMIGEVVSLRERLRWFDHDINA